MKHVEFEKSLIVFRKFKEYMCKKHISCNENKDIGEYCKFFFDEHIKEDDDSLLGILLVLYYIRKERADIRDEEEFKNCFKKCQARIKKKFSNEIKESIVGSAESAMVFFFELVFCNVNNIYDIEIKEYVKNKLLKNYESEDLLVFITNWIIGCDNNEFFKKNQFFNFKGLIPVEYHDLRMEVYYYLQDIMDELQMMSFASGPLKKEEILTEDSLKVVTRKEIGLISGLSSFNELSEKRLVECIDKLLEEQRLTELQHLLMFLSKQKYDVYEKIKKINEFSSEEMRLYFIAKKIDGKYNLRKYPERMLHFEYLKNNSHDQSREDLDAWYLKMQSRPYVDILNKDTKDWIQWFYLLEKMNFYLRDHPDGIDVVAFYKLYNKELEDLNKNHPYPYDTTEYIKKICEKQAYIFTYFYDNQLDVEELMEKFGNNNVFLHSKEGYYKSWPMKLVSNAASSYQRTRAGFENLYFKAGQEEKIIKLYFNTNIKFIYNIKTLMKRLMKKMYVEESTFDKVKNVNKILKDYRVSARVVYNEPSIRANNKVKVLLNTIYSGCTEEALLQEKVYRNEKYGIYGDYKNNNFISVDGDWCKKRKEYISLLPDKQFDCLCNIVFDKKGYIYVKNIEPIHANELKDYKTKKSKDLNYLNIWLDDIIKDKIVHNPYYYCGEDNKDKYKRESLMFFKPSQFEKSINAQFVDEVAKEGVDFARKIIEVYKVLRLYPEKCLQFLILLNSGNIDTINEFKYNYSERDNGGMKIANYTLTYSEDLANDAEDDLLALCQGAKDNELDFEDPLFVKEGLTAQMIGDIYMNTYLRQYISVPKFFEILNTDSNNISGKELKCDNFIASEHRNENMNLYMFSLTLEGSNDNITSKYIKTTKERMERIEFEVSNSFNKDTMQLCLVSDDNFKKVLKVNKYNNKAYLNKNDMKNLPESVSIVVKEGSEEKPIKYSNKTDCLCINYPNGLRFKVGNEDVDVAISIYESGKRFERFPKNERIKEAWVSDELYELGSSVNVKEEKIDQEIKVVVNVTIGAVKANIKKIEAESMVIEIMGSQEDCKKLMIWEDIKHTFYDLKRESNIVNFIEKKYPTDKFENLPEKISKLQKEKESLEESLNNAYFREDRKRFTKALKNVNKTMKKEAYLFALSTLNYFYESRFEEITKLLCDCFKNYKYDLRKCNDALTIFDRIGGNPYFSCVKNDDYKRLLTYKEKEIFENSCDEVFKKIELCNISIIEEFDFYEFFDLYFSSYLWIFKNWDVCMEELTKIQKKYDESKSEDREDAKIRKCIEVLANEYIEYVKDNSLEKLLSQIYFVKGYKEATNEHRNLLPNP